MNRGPTVKGGTVVTHKCVGTESSKISTFDLQQANLFESSAFLSNKQYHYTDLPGKNWGNGEPNFTENE